jgi:hypothetical protein
VFLTEGKGQQLCSLEETTGYSCYAECPNDHEDPKWYAQPCGGENQEECPKPILGHRKKAREEVSSKMKELGEEARKANPASPSPSPAPMFVLDYDPREVYDLRGLQCELLDGKERCFYEDSQGRDLCPEYVTAEYLAFPQDQYVCGPDMANKYFCTVGCQEGNPEIRWGAHEYAWCYAPENRGSCPKKSPVIPKKEYKLKEWSEVKEPDTECQLAWKRGDPLKPIPNLSVGMLTHEPRSMADTLATYEKWGFFQVVTDFMVYINNRRPEIDEALKPYLEKYPKIIRVMGDVNNYGIARGIIFLTGNATNEYFLFLERDFQLIEPAHCVVEQLTTGIRLIERDTAQVVRYRHRKRAGRPNWAEIMFRGHEDDVLPPYHQPNLFCNHFYWIPDPEKRWPKLIWFCHDESKGDAYMYCSDSFYCNWTNNPQLWKVSWWNKEYVSQFDAFTRNDPYYDLEVYMNWEPNSWNDRKFTVAQGQGLFRHTDRGKFGI